MKLHKESTMHYLLLKCAGFGLTAAMLGAASTAVAHDFPFNFGPDEEMSVTPPRPLIYTIPGEKQISRLYHDDSELVVQVNERWSFIHGTDTTGLTLDDLRQIAEAHHAVFTNGPSVVIDSGRRGPGLNIVYNCGPSVPSEALSAFAIAEVYLESLFSDDVTVTISCSFSDLGGSTLGATSSNGLAANYKTTRLGLQYGMDGDDAIQDWLPSGNTCPVRYDGGSPTVTNENVIGWNTAAYKATMGTLSGEDASMSFNDQVLWDYNPANGVVFNRTSFVDVVCHETGHALGFVSATDVGDYMEVLDLFRFCRLDGSEDYNPDTYSEFQTTPRIVSYNNPNDEQITDGIDFSHRMEDGNPWQASHLRLYNDAGCMCPAIGSGETRYPDYFTSTDIHCFDAIGWDYPPCVSPQFITQPESFQALCAGDNAVLSLEVDVPSATYQWRKEAVVLVDDGSHIVGATTPTLTIIGLTEDDSSAGYSCFVHNSADGCPGISDWAEIDVDTGTPVITQQPQDSEVSAGGTAFFSLDVEEPWDMEYQWRKNEAPLSDGGNISGALTSILIISPAQTGDSGQYDCVVTRTSGYLCSTISESAALTVDPGPQDCPNPGDSENYCTADIDGSGDCLVGLSDLAQLLANYGTTTGATRLDGDIDPAGGDGDVDLSDLAALLAQYGDDCN